MFKHLTLAFCLSVTAVSADEPVSTSTTSETRPNELLTTVEAVEGHVEKLIKQREAMTNYAVEFTSHRTDREGMSRAEASRVWVDGDKLREDRAVRGTIEIFTAKHNIRLEKGEWHYRADEGKRGWTDVPDLAKLGIADRWGDRNDEPFDKYLLPKNRKNIQVEMGQQQGQKITIVKFDRQFKGVKAWTEYWLSPQYGNSPVFLEYGWTNKDENNVEVSKTLISQSIRWKNYDGVWFPAKVTSVRREPPSKPSRSTYVVKRARFQIEPFPDVFSPEAVMMKFRQTTEEVEKGK